MSTHIEEARGTRLPNFLIVGAIKCGTTSLHEYLKAHPDVFMSNQKEPNFFVEDPTHKYRATEAEYRAAFAKATTEKAIGEASVAYLYEPAAAERIFGTLGPDTRIVISLRNPVEVAYALWGHMVRLGGERRNFEDAIAAWPARLRGEDEEFRLKRIGWLYNYAYIERPRYAGQVERYLRRFGPTNVKVYLFEEFFSQPESHFKDLCRFLGVNDAFVPEFKRHNATGPVLVPAIRDLMNSRGSWKRPLKRALPHWFRRRLSTTIYRLNRRNDVGLPPLSRDVRTRLWTHFEDDVKRLEGLLSRPIREVWVAANRKEQGTGRGLIGDVSLGTAGD